MFLNSRGAITNQSNSSSHPCFCFEMTATCTDICLNAVSWMQCLNAVSHFKVEAAAGWVSMTDTSPDFVQSLDLLTSRFLSGIKANYRWSGDKQKF